MQIVDMADPMSPVSLGLFDTVGAKVTYTVVAHDSFAFIGRSSPYGRQSLLVLDVLDPSNPTLAAQESCLSWPQDMVLRDSLLYAAEINYFVVANAA